MLKMGDCDSLMISYKNTEQIIFFLTFRDGLRIQNINNTDHTATMQDVFNKSRIFKILIIK